jgi:hypothetical protein
LCNICTFRVKMERSGEMPVAAAAAGKKPKQLRRRWRPDEHTRFLEALHM